MQPAHPRHRVLFVCLGNICRSPAAEIIFRKQVAEAGLAEQFEIDSAGTIGHHAGAPPDPRMSESLRQRGFKVEGSARQIQPDDLVSFDLIVTMDESNLSDVKNLDQTANQHHKIRPFVGFCRHHDDLRVPDPYYGGQRGFDHVIRMLEDGCEGILESFVKPS
jgi:protein-tyrosine phosphatase